MVQVYYHYHNMMSRRASRCKCFQTRKDADRWVYWMGRKYPAFHLDEIFAEQPQSQSYEENTY